MGIRLWTERLRAVFAERRGNVALIFGLSLPVMVLMTVGGVDIHRASTVRVNLQDALDASALAAARSPYTDPADIQRVGMDALRANLTNYPNIILREDRTTFVLNEDQVVVADGSVDVVFGKDAWVQIADKRALFGEVFRVLKPGGRLAVITFHSGEDRLVKQFSRGLAKPYTVRGGIDVPELREPREPLARELSRKAIRPGATELERNPRSRSAQLRALEKL